MIRIPHARHLNSQYFPTKQSALEFQQLLRNKSWKPSVHGRLLWFTPTCETKLSIAQLSACCHDGCPPTPHWHQHSPTNTLDSLGPAFLLGGSVNNSVTQLCKRRTCGIPDDGSGPAEFFVGAKMSPFTHSTHTHHTIELLTAFFSHNLTQIKKILSVPLVSRTVIWITLNL